MTKTITAVSAPGKVLVAGGYLVLDPKCTGLVFSLSARIHCLAVPHDSKTDPGSLESKTIVVKSPQFKDAVWKYSIRQFEDGRGVDVQQSDKSTSPNKFVQTTLRYVLTYLFPDPPSFASIPPRTTVIILADNDYYSQPSPPIPRFNNLGIPISSANKTGLGSSASLVTSLTACLLAHFQPNSRDDEESFKQEVHNLSQASHCAAQGKVGSGFDVAAATYGSCAYSRFPEDIFTPLDEEVEISRKYWANNLRSIVGEKWNMTVKPQRIPRGIRLMMCDVVGGSETPGMVKQVLAWRKTQPGADEVWSELNAANKLLIDAFSTLSSGGDDEEKKLALAEIEKLYIPLIRRWFAKMGIEATVQTEPSSQTRLLDAVSKIEGVLGGVVPGAGGFDAICVLYKDDAETKERLEAFLGDYRDGEGIVKPLGTREDQDSGIKFEDLKDYEGVEYLKEYVQT